MKRLCLVGLAAVLVATACASGPEVTLLPTADLPDELYRPERRPEVESRTARAIVYFIRTDAEGTPVRPARLGVLVRELQTDRPIAEFVMRQLLAGPQGDEQRGYRTAVPVGTELLGVNVADRVADVNLSAQFEAAHAEILQLLRLAQVVWTLTELPEVDSVRFRIHGRPQPVIDQNGVAHERVGRGRYSRFAPEETEDTGSVGRSVVPEEDAGP